jgi:hypothetical protein
MLTVAGSDLGATLKTARGIASLQESSAEVVLREPMRYAIIQRAPHNDRLLRTRGDSVLRRDPMAFVKIERVEPQALLYRARPGGPLLRLRAGTEIPGLPGFVFAETVLLEYLSYRYRPVERIVNPDPVLVSLEGSTAVLEVETRPDIADDGGHDGATQADEALLSRLRVRETGPTQYELHRGELRVILDNAGQVLGHLKPLVLPILSMRTGLQFRIRCAASDGVLGAQGFSVTSAKLARRIGIQTGDLILSLNGRPVEGFRSLSEIYQDLKRDPAVSRIDLELERDGRRLVQTYWLR